MRYRVKSSGVSVPLYKKAIIELRRTIISKRYASYHENGSHLFYQRFFKQLFFDSARAGKYKTGKGKRHEKALIETPSINKTNSISAERNRQVNVGQKQWYTKMYNTGSLK
jgi:hypothetical protein